MVDKKGKWKAKEGDFGITILEAFSNRAWEAFQNWWNNIHSWILICSFYCIVHFIKPCRDPVHL